MRLLENFNSIKVQLELRPISRFLSLILYFNSIKVQLEQFNALEAKKNRDISIP